MAHTRIMLVEVRPLLREVVQAALRHHPTLRIVAEVRHRLGCEEAVERVEPHVVVFGRRFARERVFMRRLFLCLPTLKIVTVDVRLGSAHVYDLQIREHSTGPLSIETLLTTLSEGAAGGLSAPGARS